MNTSHLKRFAQEARRKLISQVNARLELVLNTDSIALRDKASQLRTLREEINKTSKEQLVEKVAYTWFNRLMALRFMDVNDYQPLNLLAVTPREGFTLPELLHEAKQGHIPDELPVNRQHIFDLLDGRIPASNAQNEAYKELLIGACNYLHKLFPFMFERINDYTELLLPEDLTSGFSIVHDVREGMQPEDCKEVEIIGWLYQFYISEKKDEVFASKGSVKKEDIPAATQLFTPRWIVEYMVQNTVGKLWLQNRPQSRLKEFMPYYIESPSAQSSDFLKVDSVEDIRLLDQAAGSGHILVYGFELFSRIYEEEGYNIAEIPELIIRKNLFGFEIDERAAQLAALAILMKARSYNRRALQKELHPNITCFNDLQLSHDELTELFNHHGLLLTESLAADLDNMRQATNFGSLIIPQSSISDLQTLSTQIKQTTFSDAFLLYKANQVLSSLAQLIRLKEQYHCVVDNPPYMGGGNMNAQLSKYVKKHFPDSKSDLMACFMEVGLNALYSKGYLGMINQHSWMFLSSYEALRKKLIDSTFFDTMLHLGPRTFPEIGGEVVQNSAFTFWNSSITENGKYIRLVDYDRAEAKREKTLEAIQNPNCGWFYTANQNDFQKIPGSPIGYWKSEKAIKVFTRGTLKEYLVTREGMATANNDRFMRFWVEIAKMNTKFDAKSSDSNIKWYSYNKGGSFRRWYGNDFFVVNWANNGYEIKSIKDAITRRIRSHNYNGEFAFKEGITWSALTSGNFSARWTGEGYLFDSKGAKGFFKTKGKQILGFLNSRVAQFYLDVLAPTLDYKVGDIIQVPFFHFSSNDIEPLVTSCIDYSKDDWNSHEYSWDFNQNELIRLNNQQLAETLSSYCKHWTTQFFQLHQNEEELNRQFIEIYGLQEELTPDVPLEDITILQQELDRTALKELNSKLVREEGSMKVLNYNAITLPFDGKEIMAQLVSYAVGCMFGRYSLQKEGLILANQGEGLEDYLQKLEISKAQCTFLPDEDNIIPVLDEEWFADDIVTRFYSFLKVAFGNGHFEQNLAFVEQQLGKSVRKYFTRDFYTDHVRRYKKRPIYWLFSTDSGAFSVLIYMHRYTQDTINNILNMYLRQFQEKLRNQMMHLDHLINTGTAAEQSKASRDKDRTNHLLMELQQYEREVIFPMATDRIPIDLDDGVLVNYNKFGKAVKEISGLNDKKTKEKVKQFEWIDQTHIR